VPLCFAFRYFDISTIFIILLLNHSENPTPILIAFCTATTFFNPRDEAAHENAIKDTDNFAIGGF
jgi:hypothetical protein